MSALTQSPRARFSLFMSFASPEISIQKARLRLEMKARRAMLGESRRARAAWLLHNSLSEWLCQRDETRIAIYLARSFELDLDALARELIGAGKTVCAPRVDVENNRMRFFRLSELEATARGPWGVREPVSDEIVRPEIVFVPGLAFDPEGRRLGTGGGWYDRVLADIPLKFGVTFGAQIVDKVPVESHDIRMDWVASDEKLIQAS